MGDLDLQLVGQRAVGVGFEHTTRTTRAASCHDGLPPPSAAAAAAAGAAAAAVAVGAVVVVAAGGGSPRAELVLFCLRDEKRLATFRREGDESRRGADLAGVVAAGGCGEGSSPPPKRVLR